MGHNLRVVSHRAPAKLPWGRTLGAALVIAGTAGLGVLTAPRLMEDTQLRRVLVCAVVSVHGERCEA
jgi:hypothetical protein